MKFNFFRRFLNVNSLQGWWESGQVLKIMFTCLAIGQHFNSILISRKKYEWQHLTFSLMTIYNTVILVRSVFWIEIFSLSRRFKRSRRDLRDNNILHENKFVLNDQGVSRKHWFFKLNQVFIIKLWFNNVSGMKLVQDKRATKHA